MVSDIILIQMAGCRQGGLTGKASGIIGMEMV